MERRSKTDRMRLAGHCKSCLILPHSKRLYYYGLWCSMPSSLTSGLLFLFRQ